MTMYTFLCAEAFAVSAAYYFIASMMRVSNAWHSVSLGQFACAIVLSIRVADFVGTTPVSKLINYIDW
jgi:hypothetical protein